MLAINVATNGTVPAIEQARTVLETAYPGYDPPATLGEQYADANQQNVAYQQLADVVVLTSLAIAGCTLAASIAAGLAERKRPFSLLRLAGAPLGMLQRVVALESAVPLLVTAVTLHRRRVRRLGDVRGRPDRPVRGARCRVLRHHRRRHRAEPRHYRRDHAAAPPHHRPRGRQKRVGSPVRLRLFPPARDLHP